jgi:hypothetical protein
MDGPLFSLSFWLWKGGLFVVAYMFFMAVFIVCVSG